MVEKERVNNVSEIIIQETHLKKRAFGAQSALLSSISEGRCERGLRDERINQSMRGRTRSRCVSEMEALKKRSHSEHDSTQINYSQEFSFLMLTVSSRPPSLIHIGFASSLSCFD